MSGRGRVGTLHRALLAVLALVAVLIVPVDESVAGAPAAPGGAWVGLPPVALFTGTIAAGATHRLTVLGVPAGASAWLTVSETAPTMPGALTVYRAGGAVPGVATVAFAAGQAASNTAVVPTSTAGQVDVHNSATAPATVRVDVDGYFAPGAPASPGMFGVVSPLRVATALTVGAGRTAAVTVTGSGGVPSTAAVVAANVSLAAPSGEGTLTVYPSGTTRPDTQSVLFTAGRPSVTFGVVRVGTAGQVAVANASTVPVTVDISVLGYYLRGTPVVGQAFTKAAPARVVGAAQGPNPPDVTATADSAVTALVEGVAGIPATGVSAVVLMVSASGATKPGYLTAFAAGAPRPQTPFVEFAPSRPASDLVVVPLSPNGRITLYNASAGSVQVRADVVGYYKTASRLTWTAPQRPGAVRSAQLTSVSCVGSAFCLGVDVEGNSLRYDGSTWVRTLGQLSYQTASRVSCASTTFCLDVDSNGQTWRFNGTSWSSAGTVSLFGDVHLACPTSTFCMAAARAGVSSQWSTWSGSQWSQPADLPGDTFDDVSCASPAMCLASFIESGSASSLTTSSARFNGSTWSGLSTISGLSAQNVAGGAFLSCPSATFCLILSTVGATTRWDSYNGSTWATAQAAPAETGPLGLSCRSSTVCAAVVNVPGDAGAIGEAVMTFHGTGWSALTPLQSGGSFSPAISCGSSTRCVAVGDGLASVWSGAAWSTPSTVDPDSGSPLSHVRCVTASFCVATNVARAMVFNGATWSPPTKVGVVSGNPDAYQASVSALSCTSTTFCIAVTSGSAGGDVNETSGWASYDGTGWTIHPPTMTGLVSSVSCVSATWCIAVGLHLNTTTFEPVSDAWLFDGTTWSHEANLGAGTVAQTVSCVSTTWCLAVAPTISASQTRPGWSLFDGARWSAFTPFESVADGGAPQSVSCESATFCVAVDGTGKASTFDGTAWAGAVAASPSPLSDVSCVLSATCVAVGSGGLVQYAGQRHWNAPAPTGLSGNLTSASCPTATLCVAVDDRGSAAEGRAR